MSKNSNVQISVVRHRDGYCILKPDPHCICKVTRQNMITQAEKGFQVFLMTPSLHDRKNAFKQFSNKFISVCARGNSCVDKAE